MKGKNMSKLFSRILLLILFFDLVLPTLAQEPVDLHLDDAYITGTLEEWNWFADVFGAELVEVEFNNKILAISNQEFVPMTRYTESSTNNQLNFAVERALFTEVLTNTLPEHSFPECVNLGYANNQDCFTDGEEVVWLLNELAGELIAIDVPGEEEAESHTLLVSGFGEYTIANSGCGGGSDSSFSCSLEINKYELVEVLTFVLGVEAETEANIAENSESSTDTIYIIRAADEGNFTSTIEIDGEIAVVSREGIDVRCVGAVCTLYSRMFDENWQKTEDPTLVAYLVIWREIAQYSSLRLLSVAETGDIAYGANVLFVSASNNNQTLIAPVNITLIADQGWPTNFGTCEGKPVFTADDQLNRMLVLNPDGSPTQILLNANTPVCLLSSNGGSLVTGWTVIADETTTVTLSIETEPGVFLSDGAQVTRATIADLPVIRN